MWKAGKLTTKNHRQVLAAVAEIVFQMVALGLEHIIVLVFHLSTGSAIPDHGRDNGFRKWEISDERVMIDLLP